MSSTAAVNILIGVAVVGLLLVRQMQPRRARETSAARMVLILGVIGLIEISDALKGHSVDAAAMALLIASLLLGGALGAVRASTVTLWRTEDGTAWRKGTLLTAVLWIISLGAHFGMEIAIDHATSISSLGVASILLYLAVTLGVQREVVRWRAGRLLGSDSSLLALDGRLQI
jgi:hypothetical protein